MIELAKSAKRQVEDIQLSRYACYLIIQNADPRKEIVALGQTYFALQTRRQELNDQFLVDKDRISLRDDLAFRNKKLFTTAKKSWVQDYAQFNDYGYRGLYGGMRKKDIAEKKGINSKENILDYMEGEELGANIFRATQANAKIKREEFLGQKEASNVHYEVEKKVRKTIKELWGRMPEDIPAIEHIKYAKKRIKTLKVKTKMEKLQVLEYALPLEVTKIEELANIIKANGGEEEITIGGQHFNVSEKGRKLLQKLLG